MKTLKKTRLTQNHRNSSPSSSSVASHKSSPATHHNHHHNHHPNHHHQRLSIRDHLNQTINHHHHQTETNNMNKEPTHAHHHTHHHHASYHPFKRLKYHQVHTSSPKPTVQESSSTSNSKANTSTAKANSYLKCMQADSSTSPLLETLLHGERISCFVVGGEKRLCLHDILNTILREFSVQQINAACQKLQIACLEASPRQLDILKRSGLLPTGAPNCGLLTHTNAERLCAFLLDQQQQQQCPPAPPTSPKAGNTLKVVHECFGKTYGHVHLSMYGAAEAACVECDSCRRFYSPQSFVCHTHKHEAHTRHWGFDSANWRLYLKPVNVSSSVSEMIFYPSWKSYLF